LQFSVGAFHSGIPAELEDYQETGDVIEDITKPFWFYTWLHQLALSIIRALDSNSLPVLGHLRIADNLDGAYFCNCGLSHRQRNPGDPQTAVIREKLARVLKPTECMQHYSWWHERIVSLAELRQQLYELFESRQQ